MSVESDDKYYFTGSQLTELGNTIRTKAGTSDLMTLDDAIDIIAALPVGTGVIFPNNMAVITFTVEAETQEKTIAHGLGSMPTFALVLPDEVSASGPINTVLGGFTAFDLSSGTVGGSGGGYAYGYDGTRRAVASSNISVTADATNVYITSSGNYKLKPNLTYRLYAWGGVSQA